MNITNWFELLDLLNCAGLRYYVDGDTLIVEVNDDPEDPAHTMQFLFSRR